MKEERVCLLAVLIAALALLSAVGLSGGGASRPLQAADFSLPNEVIAAASADEPEQPAMSEMVAAVDWPTPADEAMRFRGPLSLGLMLIVVALAIAVIVGRRRHARRLARSREALNQALRVQEEEEARRRQLEAQHEADERYQRALKYQARHDELTGLYNKNGFVAATRRLLDQTPDVPHILLRGDITQFKLYNDLLGVEAGDRLLQLIAGELKRIAPPGVTYGRWTADHFVCCMPEGLMPLEKVGAHMAAWVRDKCPNDQLQFCIGVYRIDDPTMDVSLMCDRALLAMRTVKGLYPPKIGFYSDRLRE